MRFLLDSHTWLWLARGVELQQHTILSCCEAAASGQLLLSPMSVWEIARKASDGRLTVDGPIRSWIAGMVQTTGVNIAEFTFDVALETTQLPSRFHKDPVDRALAATCRVQGLTLLTRDRTLLRLASEDVFAAQPV